MCRDVNHGDRRCKSDTSEARRLRRKASEARNGHSPVKAVQGEHIEEPSGVPTFEEIKTEAAEISRLLSAPVNPDVEQQKIIDAQNEVRVTRLGLAMGEEAERRAGFDKDAIMKATTEEGAELVAARKELTDASDNYKKLSREYSGFCKTDAYQAKEDFAVEEEARLRAGLMEAHARQALAKKALPGIEIADVENRKRIPVEAAEKLAATYREMIAEIRPVGGEIKAHEFTHPEAAKLMAETVGSHYPSSWIKESSEAGEVVMFSSSEGRNSYSNRKPHKVEGFAGVTETNSIRVTAESGAALKLAFGDDPYFRDNTPFLSHEDDTEPKQMMTIPVRVPFDPAKDKADPFGKPEGAGWQKGHVIGADAKISPTPVWYRSKLREGIKTLPTVTVSNGRSDQSNRASAYHEFGHRMEETVGNGVIMRLEESFDARRTTDSSGNREELTRLFPDKKGMENERGRRDNYMLSYIGKQYDAGYQREVFTVGAETLFAGKFGAFTGIPDERGQSYREDKDHRGFMLGIFATA